MRIFLFCKRMIAVRDHGIWKSWSQKSRMKFNFSGTAKGKRSICCKNDCSSKTFTIFFFKKDLFTGFYLKGKSFYLKGKGERKSPLPATYRACLWRSLPGNAFWEGHVGLRKGGEGHEKFTLTIHKIHLTQYCLIASSHCFDLLRLELLFIFHAWQTLLKITNSTTFHSIIFKEPFTPLIF